MRWVRMALAIGAAGCVGDPATLVCGAGLTACKGSCVRTDIDALHCGNCDNACAADQVCQAGECGLDCVGGATRCGASCVDIDVDPQNCGDCDVVCDATQVCSGGHCGRVCGSGETNCNDVCVDTSTDPNHCGMCGNACSASQMCATSTCRPTTSCSALLQANPMLADGVYTIDPDGADGAAPFDAYCDMTTQGGGWTLVAQALPIVDPSLSLCNSAEVGSLTLDDTTVNAPAKLADTVINALWGQERTLLIKADPDSGSPTRTAWPRACSVDFSAGYQWHTSLATSAMTDLDSTTVTCSSGAWDDNVIDQAYLYALACGYSFASMPEYMVFSVTASYVGGGSCGAANAGRTWFSTGNNGCNVAKVLAR